MKKVVCVLIILMFATVAFAGEKEELTLQRQLIITTAEKLQLQQTMIQQQFVDLQKALKEVDEKLKKYEPKKEEKKK